MARHATTVELTDDIRCHLEGLTAHKETSQKITTRAQALLMAAKGHTNEDIARAISMDPSLVGRWRKRFARHGWPGVRSTRSARASGARTIGSAILSPSELAPEAQPTPTSVNPVAPPVAVDSLAEFTRQLTDTPDSRLWNIAGVYLKPPNRAVVFTAAPPPVQDTSTDEAEQSSSSPDPLAQAMTFIAMLAHLDHFITLQSDPLYRHREWLDFLERIVSATPAGSQIHVISDRHSRQLQKHWRIRGWFQAHPAVSLHHVERHDWLTPVEDFLLALSAHQAHRLEFPTISTATQALSGYYTRVRQAHQPATPFEWLPH